MKQTRVFGGGHADPSQRADRSPIIPSFSHTKARSLASSPRVSNRSLSFSQTSSPIASSFLAHSSSNLAAPKPRQLPTNHDEIPLSHVNKSDQVPLSLSDAVIALRNINLVVKVKWSIEVDEEERVISMEVSAPEPPVLNEQPPKAAEDDEEGNLFVKKRKVTILTQPLSTFKEETVPDTTPEPLPDEKKKEEKAHSKPTVHIYSLPSFTLTFSVPPKMKKVIPSPSQLPPFYFCRNARWSTSRSSTTEIRTMKKRDIQQFVWERAGKVKVPFRGATPMTPIIGKVGQSSGAYDCGGRWMVDLKKDVDAYEAEEREEEERRAHERKQLLARLSFDFDMKRQELREEKRRKRREEEQEALMKQAMEIETLSETPSSSQLAADAKRSADPLPAHQKTKSSPTKDRTEPSDTAQQALLDTRTAGSEPQEVLEPLITQRAITPTLSSLGSTSIVAASTRTTYDNEETEMNSEETKLTRHRHCRPSRNGSARGLSRRLSQTRTSSQSPSLIPKDSVNVLTNTGHSPDRVEHPPASWTGTQTGQPECKPESQWM
ncbi:hypothetical protein BLNAU_21571 [Blattamonas nauphoetae]|uniref:PEHE domain-containing protein n=1 Tax=Blattamonas nauphoetae TaxID=2049346 RepID=A0ABQ9WVH1_9EUKA|nr:hypothetical protein BLNAU_21571 [Blattamonas nauphoetae]